MVPLRVLTCAGIYVSASCRPSLPVHVSTLTPPAEYQPVRNSPNAFDHYALAAMEVEIADPAQLAEVFFYPGQKKAAIKACHTIVAEVEKAGKLPCEFKFVPRLPFRASPYQAGWRLIGRVMRWEIDDACQKSNWDAAIDTAVAATRFGFNLMGGSPTDASLGLAIADDARVAIAPYLGQMGAAQLQRVADGIAEDLKDKPSISNAIEHESENIKLASEYLEDSASTGNFEDIRHNLGPDVKEAIDYLAGIRSSQTKLSEYFRQFNEEGAAEIQYLTEIAAVPAVQRSPAPKSKVKERPWKHFAHHFFMAAFPLLPMDDRTVARTRLLMLNAELIKTDKLTKSYPSSIAGFDPRCTTDPYTGNPFRYRSDGLDYKVYSVGENLRDDGGETDESFTTPDLKLEMKD